MQVIFDVCAYVEGPCLLWRKGSRLDQTRDSGYTRLDLYYHSVILFQEIGSMAKDPPRYWDRVG